MYRVFVHELLQNVMMRSNGEVLEPPLEEGADGKEQAHRRDGGGWTFVERFDQKQWTHGGPAT